MPTHLLVVESPSKAKTLKKYLGSDFEVLASYGHVRDLEAKEGAVDPENDFHMRYALVERNRKHVDAIARAAEQADQILLATDPDREGEAIAWHLSEILRSKKSLRNRPLKRVVFYEITESAVKEGVEQPRDISMPLVNAQQARRALDHLVGFNLSPLLWRKIGPSLSAGRVQSPALRLIVRARAGDRGLHEPGILDRPSGQPQGEGEVHRTAHAAPRPEARAVLHHHGAAATGTRGRARAGGERSRHGREGREEAEDALAGGALHHLDAAAGSGAQARHVGRSGHAHCAAALRRRGHRRRHGRPDHLHAHRLHQSRQRGAAGDPRLCRRRSFNPAYLPKAPVEYRSKSKNAQEAHEAIRPTSIFRTPDELQRAPDPGPGAPLRDDLEAHAGLPDDAGALRHHRARHPIGRRHEDTLFRATGQTLVFPGYIAVYQEGADDSADEGEEKLPVLEEGEQIPVDRIFGEQHFTLPPPRYTEASLVKKLEEYGIGRPSTYASIISTLQERGYALLDKKRFQPTDLGRLVNGFLTAHFDHYVDYDFTARDGGGARPDLQRRARLDHGAARVLGSVLRHAGGEARNRARRAAARRRSARGHLEGVRAAAAERAVAAKRAAPETCPKCSKQLYLQNSKRGLFVGCSGYPKCDYTRPWGDLPRGRSILGQDPETGSGRAADARAVRPLRAARADRRRRQDQAAPRVLAEQLSPLPAPILETALKVLSLPRTLDCIPRPASRSRPTSAASART